MNYITRNLLQDVTYWAPSTPDMFGQSSFSAPTAMKGRWENKVELFIDPQGKESASQAIVYLDGDVVIDGYIYLGSSTAASPTAISDARKIKRFDKTPSLNATIFQRKIYL